MQSADSRIKGLLKKWSRSECTESEVQELYDCIDAIKSTDTSWSNYLNQLLSEEVNLGDDNPDWDGIFRKILQSRKQLAERPKITPSHIWWAAAAFLVILGGLGFFLVQKNPAGKDGVQLAENTGFSDTITLKATLDIGIGRAIPLDSLQFALGSEIEYSEGRLVYPGSLEAGNVIHTLVNPRGAKPVNIYFSEGTHIIVNAATSISFKPEFDSELRVVDLSGEAFFEVKKDARRPFLVKSQAMGVKVLGTVFNVKAYKGDPTAEATLLEGSIEVTVNNRPEKKIILRPDEKIKISQNVQQPGTRGRDTLSNVHITSLDPVFEASGVDEVLWTKNKLAFNYERLEDIAGQLERWYGVNVEVLNPALLNERFTGVFENKSIEQVVQALQAVGKFSYKIKDNAIIIN